MAHKRSYADHLGTAAIASNALASRHNVSQSDPLAHLLHEARQSLFGPEELQAALMHCGTAHPVTWLHEHWPRLVDTVQTLATKYGQEMHDGPTNRIGVLSASEARDALRQHRGNVGQAVTECVQQRESKYAEIVSRGVYDNVDIVAALSAHQGQVNMALLELAKRWNRPNRSANGGIRTTAGQPEPTNDILNFVTRNIGHDFNEPTPDGSTISEYSGGSSVSAGVEKSATNVQLSSEPLSIAVEQMESTKPLHQQSPEPESESKSPNMLRDIETLIGNMERNHMRQNEDMLRTIEDMLKQQQHHTGEADVVTDVPSANNQSSNVDEDQPPPIPENVNGDFAFFSERIDADDEVKEYYSLDRVEEVQLEDHESSSPEIVAIDSIDQNQDHLKPIVSSTSSFTSEHVDRSLHTNVSSNSDLALSLTANPLLSVSLALPSIVEEETNQLHNTDIPNTVQIVTVSEQIESSVVEAIELNVIDESIKHPDVITSNEYLSFVLDDPIYTNDEEHTNSTISANIEAPEQFSFFLPAPIVPLEFEETVYSVIDTTFDNSLYETIIGTTSELPEQMSNSSTDAPVSDDISVSFDFQSTNDISRTDDGDNNSRKVSNDVHIVDDFSMMDSEQNIFDTSSLNNTLNVIQDTEHTNIALRNPSFDIIISAPPIFVKADMQDNLTSTNVLSEIETVHTDKTIWPTDSDEIESIETLPIDDTTYENQRIQNNTQSSDGTALEEDDSQLINLLEPQPLTTDDTTTTPTHVIRQLDEDDLEKPAERMNLSDMVLDTQKMIQQMRDELNSDIATFTSEEEDGDDEDDYDDRDDTFTVSGAESGEEEWSEEFDEEGEMEEERAGYTDEEGEHVSDYTDDEVPPESDTEYEEEIEIVQIDIEQRNGHQGESVQTSIEFVSILPPDEFLDQHLLSGTPITENSDTTVINHTKI